MEARPARPLRGILLMVLAVSTFSCLDATSKYLTQIYPVPQIVWARYVFQVILMLLVLGPVLRKELVRTSNLKLQVVRGIVLTASSVVFLTSLSYLPMAEAASIAFIAPMIVAVLAGPMLHEKVDGRTWLALAGGFTGVLLIVRPGGGLFGPAAVLPLVSAFLMALYQMLTRKLAGRDKPITTLFYPAVVGTLAVPVVFPVGFSLPDNHVHVAMFVLLGILGSIGHFFLIRAHDYATASTLAPFSYAQLIVVLFLGWLVFGQLPDGVALAGMLVVAGSGVFLILSHRRR